ncbi:hypothetical protein QQ045_007265 [Rhodiola kirilowii]
MGQASSSSPSPSANIVSNRRDRSLSRRFFSASIAASISSILSEDEDIEALATADGYDYTSDIPDECLACIFQSLPSVDRKHCSLVCQRWFVVEGQSRHRLSLNASAEIVPDLPTIFSRFDSVTKLSLRCDRRSVSIGDDALELISLRCRNLKRLKLRGCRELTDAGIAVFAQNCSGLKKLSCGSCMFGAKGLNAILDYCSGLEEISVKRLRSLKDGGGQPELIGPGAAAVSLKIISLKELYNGQCFAPLVIGSKKLKTLKVFRCLGEWDRLLETIGEKNTSLTEVHLERLQVSDFGLAALSNCSNLEILHIVKTPECTSTGLVSVAEGCRLLRKLHIDGWRTNRIGDEGLIAVAKNCPNLQELVLIGVNPTHLSLTALANSCRNLERLALCGSESIRDEEIVCISEKCLALRKLCIKGCPISDHGMKSLAWGFPNLVKIKVKKCRGVTSDIAGWLQINRGSLVVILDGQNDATDVIVQENDSDAPRTLLVPAVTEPTNADAPSSSASRSTPFRSRLSLFAGKNFVACTFRRWTNDSTASNSNTKEQL